MLMRELDLSEWMRWMELNEMRLMIIEWRKKSRRGREKGRALEAAGEASSKHSHSLHSHPPYHDQPVSAFYQICRYACTK